MENELLTYYMYGILLQKRIVKDSRLISTEFDCFPYALALHSVFMF